MTFDDVTFIVWIAILPVWLVWEIVLLVKRGQGVAVRTLSMVAQKRGWQLTAVVYFWTAMPIHWWVPLHWGSTAGGIAFWALQLALFGWNIATWKATGAPLAEWAPWRRWVNWPVWYLVVGPLAAAFLFPQAGATPWAP